MREYAALVAGWAAQHFWIGSGLASPGGLGRDGEANHSFTWRVRHHQVLQSFMASLSKSAQLGSLAAFSQLWRYKGNFISKEDNPMCIPDDRTVSKHPKKQPQPFASSSRAAGGHAKIAASGACTGHGESAEATDAFPAAARWNRTRRGREAPKVLRLQGAEPGHLYAKDRGRVPSST